MATFEEIIKQGFNNLKSWGQVLTQPQVRNDYANYVIKQPVQKTLQNIGQTLTPPGGWNAGIQRVKQTPWQQFTPLSMKSAAVPSSMAVFNAIKQPQLGQDVGFFLKGATSQTPFGGLGTDKLFNVADPYKATTPRQQKAEYLGSKAPGVAVTAAVGGLPLLAQGATLNAGINMVGNVLQGNPAFQDTGKSLLEGGSKGWQLALTNSLTDKIASKFFPALQSKVLGQSWKLAKNTLMSGSKKELIINGIKRSVQRALLETPTESAFYTIIDRLDPQKQESFLETLGRNVIGSLAGNLAFAGISSSFNTGVALTSNQRKQFGDLVKKGFDRTMDQLKRNEGYINLQGMQPKQRLKDLIQYSDQLHRLGYSEKEIEKIGFQEGQRIIQNNIHVSKQAEDIIQNLSVKNKVGILDKLRTPDRVLAKMGLKNEADQIRASWDNYLEQLPKEINKITDWSKRVDPEANERIFDFLDGKKINLAPNELQVATEIKDYLKSWADKLGLQPEHRISNYITHIFEKGTIEKEFQVDPELEAIMRTKVAKSVYDPFLQARKDAPEYVRDVWRALDAYTKRATRKFNMDPILKKVGDMAEGMETSQYNYLKKYIDRINLRPTDLDNEIDTSIKQVIGYKFGQRPVTVLTQKMRQATYRGLLGLNVQSALRNLTQGTNTYAELGERYTLTGYIKLIKNWNTGELEKVGVLKDSFIQDRTISAVKSFWQKADKVLFFMFEQAEKINRGAAYFGAKTKGMNQGMTEEKAIEYAKNVVRKTQFVFGQVDSPQIFQSDIAKTLLQFQSYTVKQVEFLGEKVMAKDIAAVTRYALSNLVIYLTVGKALGWDITDMLPSVRIGTPPTLQLLQGMAEVALKTPDKYGQPPDPNFFKRLIENQNIQKGVINYIPGGSQIKRSIEGIGAGNRGYSETPSGNVRFPIPQTTGNRIKTAVFGQYASPEAKEYFDSNRRPLSANQTEAFKNDRDTYQQVMDTRANNKLLDQAKTIVEQTGQPQTLNDKYIFIDKDGTTKTLDKSFEPTVPVLSGNSELDKQLLSKFGSEITKAKGIAVDLFEQGQISAETAEKRLNDLSGLKISIASKSSTKKGSAKKITGKKITVGKITIAKAPAMKTIKIAKAPKPAKFKIAKLSAGKAKVYSLKKPKKIAFKISKPTSRPSVFT